MRSYFHFPYIEHNEAINDCQHLPNNTEIKPHFYQCKEDTTVRLHGGALTNLTGDDHYPVTFNDSIRIFLDVTSSSSRRNDYDICSNNAFCPLVPGRQVIEFSVDPTPLFTRLFRMIHHDLVSLNTSNVSYGTDANSSKLKLIRTFQSAYQLIIRLRDNSEPFNELLCATIQTRIQL
uniref:CUB domain-containing protein n=1 Tax=Heterorhabditis bacteriophora TaxID=37862 RepID=A0A1I7XU99_HETBA